MNDTITRLDDFLNTIDNEIDCPPFDVKYILKRFLKHEDKDFLAEQLLMEDETSDKEKDIRSAKH